MDGEAFDRLSVVVHRLRDGATRRRALQALTAGGVAGLLARLGAGEAGAACVRRRRRCSRDQECCGYPGGNVACDRLPRACDRGGERCCGRTGARCAANCDCCKGFKCGGNGRCRSDDGVRLCGGIPCQQG